MIDESKITPGWWYVIDPDREKDDDPYLIVRVDEKGYVWKTAVEYELYKGEFKFIGPVPKPEGF